MKILVLTHRLPFAPNRGDRIRAFHIVKLLATRADVHVLSLVHDRGEEAEADTLRRLGVSVSTALVPRVRNLARAAVSLGTAVPLTHMLLDSPGMQSALDRVVRGWVPDIVLAYCSGVAPLALSPPLSGIPFILDLVDVDSAKWRAFADSASFPLSWVYRREARSLAAFEAAATRSAVATLVVNERERRTLLQSCPGADALVVPNGVDLDAFSPPEPPSGEPRVIFTAVFDYAPNVEGALWFARQVWPRVLAAVPAASLTLAGARPTRAIRMLGRTDPSVEVTGSVPDMRPYLWRSAVAVAPIREARGVQNKVLEAVAAGLPAVATRVVREGLPADVLPACRCADTAEDFAQNVIDLLTLSPTARRREASRARLSALSWAQRLGPLLELSASRGNRGHEGNGLTTVPSVPSVVSRLTQPPGTRMPRSR